ncbi:MAG TPA: tRNA (guanosine(46)-N7)-methyltransferase TrmB [Perlabentimonas sp.]|nr:tRNA (guanosine(46)-N7)-methyltransferase TrmB [Perlabentimonas sp.]
MGKNKLKKFTENETFSNLLQPASEEVFIKDHPIKGEWNRTFFKNSNPIVLELGCGKGEYTINLAKRHPDKNFIGVDIKGARLWKGAKEATENSMANVGFIRMRIEHITSFFSKDEVSEIWITFPDPQARKSEIKKRLSSSRFLSLYQRFTKQNAQVHLKTDSQGLHEYTKALIEQNDLRVHVCTNDLYGSGIADDILSIRTFYESMFLEQGNPITYIQFELDNQKILNEPELE